MEVEVGVLEGETVPGLHARDGGGGQKLRRVRSIAHLTGDVSALCVCVCVCGYVHMRMGYSQIKYIRFFKGKLVHAPLTNGTALTLKQDVLATYTYTHVYMVLTIAYTTSI